MIQPVYKTIIKGRDVKMEPVNDSEFFPYNQTNMTRELFNPYIFEEKTGSDEEVQVERVISYFIVKRATSEQVKRHKNAFGFFPYWNLSMLDLSKYQIFKPNDQIMDFSNCFLYALKQYAKMGAYDGDIERLKPFFFNRSAFTPSECLKIIESNNLPVRVWFQRYDDNGKCDGIRPVGDLEGLRIDCFKNHFFIHEPDNIKKIMSAELIDMTVDEIATHSKGAQTFKGHIAPPDAVLASDVILREYKPSKRESRRYEFFDTEALVRATDIEGKTVHLCHALCSSFLRPFWGLNCVVDFLDAAIEALGETHELILYAHNLTYDVQFFFRTPECVFVGSEIRTNNRIICATCQYRSSARPNQTLTVEFRDSYALIPLSLGNFGKAFGLEQQKEVYPYHQLEPANLYGPVIPISEIGAYEHEGTWSSAKTAQMIENAKICGAYHERNQTINMKTYCLFYCQRDVEVLRNGFEKFKQTMKEQVDVDILEFYTLPSIAGHCMKRSLGSYYTVKGYLEAYIRQSIHGGRVASRFLQKWHLKDAHISDADKVALYPFVMSYVKLPIIDHFEVIPANISIEELDSKGYAYYFVDIHIKRIGKVRGIPQVWVDRKLVNQIEASVETVGTVALHEYIKWSAIDYEILGGVGIVGSSAPLLSELMQGLFDLRNSMRKDGNPCNNVIKLLMNSAYGKMLQKPIECEIVHPDITRDTFDINTYIVNQFEAVKSYNEDTNTLTRYKITALQDSMVIYGAIILEESKRVMNKIIYTAEDLGIPVYYTDTDSMHIPSEGFDRVIEYLKETEGVNYKGKLFHQFHNDFDVSFDTTKYEEDPTREPYAKEVIILGKKAYMDRLVVPVIERATGKHCEVEGYHFRLKGVPSACLSPEAYEKLFRGETVQFDLLRGTAGIKIDPVSHYIFQIDNDYMRRLSFDSVEGGFDEGF